MRRADGPIVGPTWRDPVKAREMIDAEIDVHGTPVQIVGVHLTSRLPYGPPIQLRRLSRQLDGAAGPAVLTGDCNFWGPPAQQCLPGWTRGVRGRSWPAPDRAA